MMKVFVTLGDDLLGRTWKYTAHQPTLPAVMQDAREGALEGLYEGDGDIEECIAAEVDGELSVDVEVKLRDVSGFTLATMDVQFVLVDDEYGSVKGWTAKVSTPQGKRATVQMTRLITDENEPGEWKVVEEFVVTVDGHEYPAVHAETKAWELAMA